jgi:hypothetical protein
MTVTMNVFIAHYVLENFLLHIKERVDIEDHVKTAKHRSAINATASANIRDLFKAKDGNNNNSDLECAAKEVTFSYHTARHELSFKTSDCTSKLIKKLYDPKFSSARTKTETIINVISSFIFDNVLRSLENINYNYNY